MSPLRRFQTSASSRAPVAGARQPLVKLATLQSVVCACVPGPLGCPDPVINASSFPTDRDGLPPAPSPCLLQDRVHPLVSFASSTEFVPASDPPDARRRQAPPLGFQRLLRDMSSASPLTGGFPRPTYVPPAAFLTLSTAYSSLHLVGLFHPTATSEIRPSGVFPDAQPA